MIIDGEFHPSADGLKNNYKQMKNYTIKGIFLFFVFCLGGQLLNAQTQHIPANDANIAFRGMLYPILSADSVVLNRHSPDFFTIASGFFNSTKGRTQSGIVVSFKTASPILNVNFKKRADAQQNPAYFGVYKDNVFQENYHIAVGASKITPLIADQLKPI
jgi:hypothetical protein